MRRMPILPTLVVLIAAGIMVRLGIWQLERLHQKEAMLAQFAAQVERPQTYDWAMIDGRELASYSRVSAVCRKVISTSAKSGRNAQGAAGWAHLVRCEMASGPAQGDVVLGWSPAATNVVWGGGVVTGRLLAFGNEMPRIVADPPLAGLQPNARPDPRDLPNNHLAYAVQWFLFAGVALLIYGLAVRKRWRG